MLMYLSKDNVNVIILFINLYFLWVDGRALRRVDRAPAAPCVWLRPY